MSYAEFLLALCLWREARGEGDAGMTAVGCVIRNRVNDWKQDWRKVIVGANQFSSMTIQNDPNTVLWPLDGDPVFGIAHGIIGGSIADTTGGAHFYANEAAITSDWYRVHIMESTEHPVTATVGHHTFRK